MKKFIPMAALLGAVLTTGCSDKKTMDFAERVAEYVKANQVDSLVAVYPSANFDSIAFTGDYETVEIEKTDIEGTMRARFGNVAYIDIKKGEDGDLNGSKRTEKDFLFKRIKYNFAI